MVLLNGTHRLVLLLGPLAIKFPRFVFLFSCIYDPSSKRFGPFCYWSGIAGLRYFWWGMRENWDEYKAWRNVHAGFLAPTYLSFGIINVQRRILGEEVSDEVAGLIWQQLYDRLGIEEAHNGDQHTLRSPSTYRRQNGRIVMIDYGTFRRATMRVFMARWKEEFETILKDAASA